MVFDSEDQISRSIAPIFLYRDYFLSPHLKFIPMTESKLQWKGWHQFTGMPDFLKFVKANKDIPYNTILWLNLDCPIVIWLN